MATSRQAGASRRRTAEAQPHAREAAAWWALGQPASTKALAHRARAASAASKHASMFPGASRMPSSLYTPCLYCARARTSSASAEKPAVAGIMHQLTGMLREDLPNDEAVAVLGGHPLTGDNPQRHSTGTFRATMRMSLASNDSRRRPREGRVVAFELFVSGLLRLTLQVM